MSELESFELQLAEAERNRQTAQADIADAKERYDRETRRVKALTQVVKGLRDLETTKAPPQPEGLPMRFEPVSLEELEQLMAPRGQEALRQVMRGSGQSWRPAQLISEIKSRGWIDPDAKTPDAAIRVALRRLVDGREVEKSEQGLYSYIESDATASEPTVPAAEGLDTTTGEGVA
jgi:hypothetical protein